MKTQIAFKLAVVSAMAITLPTAAQTFSGTNAPDTGADFSFTVGAPLPTEKQLNQSLKLCRTQHWNGVFTRHDLTLPQPAKTVRKAGRNEAVHGYVSSNCI
jgi:hypothetical protein